MLIVSKTLGQIVNQYRVDFAIANKHLSFTTWNKALQTVEMKVFDDKIIQELEKNLWGLKTTASKLMKYIDEKIIGEPHLDPFLHFLSRDDSHSEILDVLLKLAPSLNTITDSYLPTSLFRACHSTNAPDFINARKLIRAGADFRIKNPEGDTCFDKCRNQFSSEAKKAKVAALENEAKEIWKESKREKTPVPTMTYSVQNLPWNQPGFRSRDDFI